jgi:hypothetical protein
VCDGKNARGNKSDNILPGKLHGGYNIKLYLRFSKFKIREPYKVVVKKGSSCVEKKSKEILFDKPKKKSTASGKAVSWGRKIM